MKRIALVHNPGAGSQTDEERPQIEAELRALGELTTHLVDEAHAPAALARAALEAGVDVLVASGGDGTVSACAAAILGREDVVLGIVPRGTGNSIATTLGIPKPLDEACAVIAAGHARRIDTARVGERPMVLMACVGLHADSITETPTEAKQALGKLAYAITGLTLSATTTPFEIAIGTDEDAFELEASALTIANLAPRTTVLAQGPGELVPDDGLLDVTLVATSGLLDTVATGLHLAQRALEGLPADRENVAYFRTAHIRVSTAEPMTLMVDGEDAGTTPFEVVCVPRSLSVLVPAPAPAG